jgi:hypothetical protein
MILFHPCHKIQPFQFHPYGYIIPYCWLHLKEKFHLCWFLIQYNIFIHPYVKVSSNEHFFPTKSNINPCSLKFIPIVYDVINIINFLYMVISSIWSGFLHGINHDWFTWTWKGEYPA